MTDQELTPDEEEDRDHDERAPESIGDLIRQVVGKITGQEDE